MHKLSLSYQLHSLDSASKVARTLVDKNDRQLPDWSAPLANNRLSNPLIDLLYAVHSHGSIAAAARHLGFSYRHVWGTLKQYESSLGFALVAWEKGQSAQLTEFANKLLWAERQAQARLAPAIESLHNELERCFAVAFDPNTLLLSVAASHDEGLSHLRQWCAEQSKAMQLDISFVGSVEAVKLLSAGQALMGGFHTVLGVTSNINASQLAFQPHLHPKQQCLIGFAMRSQGLMVAKGNPLQIQSIQDLVKPNLRFVNRAQGTGTRLLLDQLLQQLKIERHQIRGYETIEPSHAAVAQAIGGGLADVGLGIEASARAKNLSFIPIVQEHYFLVCNQTTLTHESVKNLLHNMQSTEWQNHINQIPGYQSYFCGEVLDMASTLRWWQE